MTNDPQHQSFLRRQEQAGELLARLFHEAACRRLTGFERLACTTSLQGHDLFLEAQQDAEGALYLDLVLPQTTRLAGLTDDAVETIPLRLSFDLSSARELVETITDWLDCNDPTARSRTVDPIR